MDKEITHARLNISQLAGITGVHRTTLAARLKGVPLAPGSNKQKKLYYLKDILCEFLNNSEPVDVEKMKPSERQAHYNAELLKVKLEREQGELIPVDEVVANYAAIVKAVVMELETLPDVLERDCALPPEAVARVQEVIDDLRDVMADKIRDEDPEEEEEEEEEDDEAEEG